VQPSDYAKPRRRLAATAISARRGAVRMGPLHPRQRRPPALRFLQKYQVMAHVTLSARNQIVIPREAREALGAKAGDQLLVVVRGDKVIVIQKPKAHHAAIRGLASGLYPGGYLKKERGSWT
jgi:AbrB family looped-hinge helix DNA binding protein